MNHNLNRTNVFPAESLVAQAALKTLPLHQYMDATTASWIAFHTETLPSDPQPKHTKLPENTQVILHQAPIPVSWQKNPALVDTLHGTRHLMRTAVMAALVAQQHHLDIDTQTAAVVAAAVHDCRRVDDKGDPGHGQRGAAWLTEHAETVFTRFGLHPTQAQVSAAVTAVRLHETNYDQFTDQNWAEYAQHRHVVDVVKTADALDRYRLPKRSWWPDHRFLRVLPKPWMHRLAFDLVVTSELAYLSGHTSASAVRGAVMGKGLM